MTPWAKDQLTERLVGIAALDESSNKGWCKITSLDKMEGEVTVQSRKQKKFPLYELELTLIVLVLGAFIFSYILSSVNDLVKKYQIEETNLEEKLLGVREFCAKNSLAPELA